MQVKLFLSLLICITFTYLLTNVKFLDDLVLKTEKPNPNRFSVFRTPLTKYIDNKKQYSEKIANYNT